MSTDVLSQSLNLPEDLKNLGSIAGNLYWSWNRKLRILFEEIDPVLWNKVGENPIALIKSLSRNRIEELHNDQRFRVKVSEAYETLNKYNHEESDTWFWKEYGSKYENNPVAYFSAEFGVASCLKIYAGGLGILAGDLLKSASDLGVPLVGVGLFYRKGYFAQTVSDDGWQQEQYPENKPELLPISPVFKPNTTEPLLLSVPMERALLMVRAWHVYVGRIGLYLLDSNVPEYNSKDDCNITSELYGGDSEARLRQELILGFGGAELLLSLGIRPSIYHMNEGHSAFVGLERIREILEESPGKFSFGQALEMVKERSLFTTHTPVPAGIDIFTQEQIQRYLSWYCEELEIPESEILSLGLENQDSETFNMAVLAIKLSQRINAVSRLHGMTVRTLWEKILKQRGFILDGDNVRFNVRQVGSITNGIHIPSWISDPMADVYEHYLGEQWSELRSNQEVWSKSLSIPNDVLWNVRCSEREKLVQFVRRNRLDDTLLDPKALTIGFARRFATYKRATLIFSDRDRLCRMLSDFQRPIQLVFSGKAHPLDNEGKKMMQELVRFTKNESARSKIVFLPDYDIFTARRLVQGVDLWLNNPRRPLEACGTSGMKVLANGGLNVSVLDGWWDEAYAPSRGWSIGTSSITNDQALQDRQDSESLYDVLEHSIIPEFYERSNSIPSKWIERMKLSISELVPQFSSNRMLIDYTERHYLPNMSRPDERF
ncbi:MAG: alpha-glucan family phosphorylase [Nitrososphaerota archaeon]|nr:alpha-glucan family phosphorylase [Nitrososphaerota archaeon]